MLLLILIWIYSSYGKEVILSSGLGNWNHDQLLYQYNAYGAYANMKIITAASLLIYNLDDDGNLGVYETNDINWTAEKYQLDVSTNFKLKSVPCLYCDATQGMCINLSEKLEKLYKHQDEFIKGTITKPWDGYVVDFEPDENVDKDKLTDFIIKWGIKLHTYNKTLTIWTGASTAYDMTKLNNISNIINLISMDTYVNDYDTFINNAGNLIISTNQIPRIGFGLLTDNLPDTELIKIIKWLHNIPCFGLSIWASIIPPSWYESLYSYLNL